MLMYVVGGDKLQADGRWVGHQEGCVREDEVGQEAAWSAGDWSTDRAGATQSGSWPGQGTTGQPSAVLFLNCVPITLFSCQINYAWLYKVINH